MAKCLSRKHTYKLGQVVRRTSGFRCIFANNKTQCYSLLQLTAVKQEMVDMRAYQAVYKQYSMKLMEERRIKLPQIDEKRKSDENNPTLPTKQQKHCHTQDSSRDPFRVRQCIEDIDYYPKESNKVKPIKRSLPPLKTNKKCSVQQLPPTHQSLLPGNCTSCFSVRQFYQKEKDKILDYWDLKKQRKRVMRRLQMNQNLRVPYDSSITWWIRSLVGNLLIPHINGISRTMDGQGLIALHNQMSSPFAAIDRRHDFYWLFLSYIIHIEFTHENTL